ncbi:MAG: hypothetical protein GJ680_17665 [Alteromonadaceae bacterium]|nr:hypothetical protein [Alteromonadaceae bacterium]
MNINELKKMFNKLGPMAEDFGLVWLLIIAILLIVVLVIASGKKINIKIPFLPRGFNRISFSRDDITKLWKKTEKLKENKAVVAKPKVNVMGGLVNAVQLLSGGHEKRYKLPTYLMISGGEQSNDSAILRELEAVLGKKEQRLIDRSEGEQTNTWYLFQQGCVVHHENVHQVVTELKQFRPERPLDGIVVTLPVSLLQESDTLELENWSTEVYKKIWSTQQRVGFILPVYVIITEAEKLQGFNTFWSQEHLRKFRHHQFGWANPYNDSQAYQTSWISEAIDLLVGSLRSAQLAIINSDRHPQKDKPSEALLLANSLASLEQRIGIVCNELFGSAALQNPLMFRGLYFTGALAQGNGQAPQQLFIQDLFEQKIFAEHSLAFPPQNKLLSSNSRLRAYQYTSIATIGLLAGLLAFDTVHLEEQTESLVSAIENQPQIQATAGLEDVNRVLNHISHIDAGAINYLSMPLSWHNPFNDEVERYFSEEIFDGIVFPAFQCRMQNKILSQILSFSDQRDAVDFSDKLDLLALDLLKEKELEELITEDRFTIEEVEQRFTDLVAYLYNEKLPPSFYERSSLYLRAISNHANKVKNNPFCKIQDIKSPGRWNQIKQLANNEIEIIAREVAAPKEFFRIGEELNSLPSVVTWYNSIPEFADSLKDFNRWNDHLKNYWLNSHTETNECTRIQDSLKVIRTYFGYEDSFEDDFQERCLAHITQTMENDNQTLVTDLYSKTSYPMILTESAISMFDAISTTMSLSYMEDSGESDYIQTDRDFFWSTEKLNQALGLFEEYKEFAQTHYVDLRLPNRPVDNSQQYLAQGVALKQLQFSMNRIITSAMVEELPGFRPQSLRPISQQEAYLAAAVGNFRKSMDSILALILTFQKLEFEESEAWLKKLSQDHAYKLLQKVDKLYRDNRIFTPLEKPKWSAHQYNTVLFGISGDGQLQDYLSAQSERSIALALEYAEPLVVFLLNTKGKYINYSLFGKWQNTLIEINKHQNKDPSNSLEQIGQFMANELATVNQSNCFSTTSELVKPGGSDVFSLSHRQIVERAISHCNSYKADQIKKEYAQISKLFTDLLADKAPFSKSAGVRNVSPKVMRDFLTQYKPLANGLAQRMAILAWKDNSYEAARGFVRELDKAALLFENILLASGKDSSGLEVEFEFNVMQELSAFTQHLASWTLTTGEYQVNFPGTPTPVFWTPSDTVDLTLDWAQQSPYQGFPINGTRNLNDQMQYRIEDIWGLLRFIQDYSASEIDTESLVAESKLLKFEANVLAKNGQSQPPQPNVMRAFARVTVYGIDTDTKQKIPLTIPSEFPEYAPEVINGGQ